MEANSIVSKIFNWTVADYAYEMSELKKRIYFELYGEYYTYSKTFEWWMLKQMDVVNWLMVYRWELKGVDRVDEPVLYAIYEDWKEEIESQFALVYPPANLDRDIVNEQKKSSWENEQ